MSERLKVLESYVGWMYLEVPEYKDLHPRQDPGEPHAPAPKIPNPFAPMSWMTRDTAWKSETTTRLATGDCALFVNSGELKIWIFI